LGYQERHGEVKGSLDYPCEINWGNRATIRLEDWEDLTTLWVVLWGGEYTIKPDDRVIVDLGANIGIFAVFAAHRAAQSKVIAVEAFPSTFTRLRDHLDRNGLAARVTAVNVAVCGEDGTVSFTADEDIASHSRRIADSPACRTIDVEGLSPDSLLKPCRGIGHNHSDVGRFWLSRHSGAVPPPLLRRGGRWHTVERMPPALRRAELPSR
jgi:FkbM family methyltransferase